MKRILLLLLAAIAIHANGHAQSFQWAKSAGGSAGESGTSVTTDPWGNVYAVGSFQSATVTFGATTLTNAGSSDIYFVKYNAAGTVIWAKKFGGTGQEDPGKVTTDAAGNVYFNGTFTSSTLTIGTTTLSNVGSYDIFVAKFDSSGNVKWAKSAGGAGQEGSANIAVDAAGNVFISGFFLSSSMTFSTVTLPHTGDDIFFAKYDSSGNALWAKNPGGGGWAEGPGLATDGAGNLYVTGHYEISTITFGATTLSNSGGYDVYLAKYTPSGSPVWARKIGGTGDEFATSVTMDAAGMLYITGYFTSASLSVGTSALTNAGSYDIYIAKFDSSGTALWAKSAGGSGVDYGDVIISDARCNLYISGKFSSPSLSFGATTLTNAGGDDVYIAKFDSSGSAIWARGVGGTGSEEAEAIAITATGNIYVTGYFGSPSLVFGATTLTNAGSSDMFLAKLNDTCTASAGTITGSSTITIGYPITLIDTTSGGTWSSSNTAIATVGSAGTVTGLSVGTDTIKYTVTNVCGTAVATKVITVNPTTTTAPCYVPLSGLVAWYPFTGNAIDSTGRGNNGTVYGATLTSDRFGNPGSAYKFFGGDTSYIQTPISNFSSGNFTICAWAKSTQNVQNSSIIASRNASDELTGFGFDTSNAYFYIATSPGSFNTIYPTGTSFNLVDNQWHYYAAIYKGDTMSLYVDNNLRGQFIGTFTSSIIANFKIGLDDLIYGGELRGFIGSVDDIGFWNRALTPCELLKLYNASCSGVTAGSISGTSALCAGSNVTLTETTSGGTWSSSNTPVATVGSTGIVTGISGGAATISYTITNVCGSVSATKTVTVNPLPALSGSISPPAICNSTLFNYVPASSVPGTIFTWSRSVVAGISNPTATGAGSITETLTNTTASPVTVTYVYTLTAAGCSNAQTVTVVVNPTPVLSSALTPPPLCSGTLFSYAPASATTGVTFSWSRAPIAGISNPAATGIANINETLVSTTPSPVVVTYVYTLAANGCINAQNVTVTINPLPVSGSISGIATLCTGATTSYTDASPGGLWGSTNSNISVSGGGIATGISAGTDSIEYIVANSCGTAIAFKAVTVNPSPIAGTITGLTSVCIGSTVSLADVAFGGTWSSSSSATASVVSTGIVAGVSVGSATISYTVTNTCGSVSAVHAITVNPLPNAGSITGAPAVCVGSNISLADAAPGGLWSATNSNAFVSGGGIADGITAGIDTVRYTVTNACGTASASKVITVNPLPDAGAIVGLNIVCPAASITLTDGSVGGVWSATNGNAAVLAGVVTGVTSGMDSIKYTVINGCGTAVTAHPITINPLPVVSSIAGPSSVCQESYITLSDSVIAGVWTATNSNALISSTGVAYGVTMGIDTIIYTITNSCGSVNAKKTITINQLPNAGVISGPNELCAGHTITLTDSSSGGVWSSSNILLATIGTTGLVTAISAGNVFMTYAVSNVCGTASATAGITINPLPNADTITGASTVCPGQVIYLADAALGGIWTSSDNSLATVDSAGVVSGISSGNVIISYTVINSCGSSSALNHVTVESQAACNDLVAAVTSLTGIQVYPNPNKGEFTITGSLGNSINDAVTIEITDLLGQTVYKHTVAKQNDRFNCPVQLSSNIANGIYILKIRAGSEVQIFHVVVEQ